MTDEYTYLKQRMDRLESRVDMIEKIVRPDDEEGGTTLGPPPGHEPREDRKWALPDANLRMIEATIWSIYDLIMNQSTTRTDNYANLIDIKNSQASVQQAVSEIRADVQAILAALPGAS